MQVACIPSVQKFPIHKMMWCTALRKTCRSLIFLITSYMQCVFLLLFVLKQQTKACFNPYGIIIRKYIHPVLYKTSLTVLYTSSLYIYVYIYIYIYPRWGSSRDWNVLEFDISIQIIRNTFVHLVCCEKF